MQIEDGRKSSTLGVLTSTRSFLLCGCLCASRVNSDPSFQDNLRHSDVHSRKQTWNLKHSGWGTNFLLGSPIFKGYVSFREGKSSSFWVCHYCQGLRYCDGSTSIQLKQQLQAFRPAGNGCSQALRQRFYESAKRWKVRVQCIDFSIFSNYYQYLEEDTNHLFAQFSRIPRLQHSFGLFRPGSGRLQSRITRNTPTTFLTFWCGRNVCEVCRPSDRGDEKARVWVVWPSQEEKAHPSQIIPSYSIQ